MSVHASHRIDNPNGVDTDDLVGKDATELELEKVLFGDDIGFHESLKPHGQISAPTSKQAEQVRLQEEGLEEIDDSDVCILNWALGLHKIELIPALALLH